MLKKLITSGYLKSMIISLAIILLAVAAVLVLDWRDSAAAPPAGNETAGRQGPAMVGRASTDGTTAGQPPVDGAEAENPTQFTITPSGDGTFTITAPPQGDGEGTAASGEPITAVGPASPQGEMDEETLIAMLDRQVEGGRMTREEADEALVRFRNGEGVNLPFGGGMGGGMGRPDGALPEGVEAVRGEDGTVQYYKDGVLVAAEDIFPQGQPGQGRGGPGGMNPASPAEDPPEQTDTETDKQGG